MSDFQHNKCDPPLDDVLLMERALIMMRQLFSCPAAFGPYADKADRYKYTGDNAGTVDVFDADEKNGNAIQKQATVFVKVGRCQTSEVRWLNDESLMPAGGAKHHYTFMESAELTFRVVTGKGTEARLLSRIIWNYCAGFKDVLKNNTGGQVIEARPAMKTEPSKYKDEANADNLWVSDVVVSVKWQTDIIMAVVSPVLSELIVTPTVMDKQGDILIQS